MTNGIPLVVNGTKATHLKCTKKGEGAGELLLRQTCFSFIGNVDKNPYKLFLSVNLVKKKQFLESCE